MEHVSDDQRRARLGRRHRIDGVDPAPDPVAAADAVVALHGTDPTTIFLSPLARMAEPSFEAVDHALHEDRSLLRVLAMRRTLFVASHETAPAILASSTRDLAKAQRAGAVRELEKHGLAEDGAAWIEAVEREVRAVMQERRAAYGAELSQAVPALQVAYDPAPGKPYGRMTPMTSRLLVVLGCDGLIARGRPRGSWVSSQHQWVLPEDWWGPEVLAREAALTTAEAQAQLVRAYLARFGPATEADVKWWTGWTLGATRKALAGDDVVQVALDGGATGYVLADDPGDPSPAPAPWVALLPALDPTSMGWTARAWYLGPHKERLFDRNGNVGPTIWLDGRIVGGWAFGPDGVLATHLLERVGRKAERAVADAAARLTDLLGDRRFTPRFRTPLEQELLARRPGRAGS